MAKTNNRQFCDNLNSTEMKMEFYDAKDVLKMQRGFAGPMYVKTAENTKIKVYFIFISHATSSGE